MFLVMLVLLLFGFPMMVPLIVGAVVGFVMMFDGFDRMDFFIQQMLA
ncbi:MAG TPA: C4-dicarboxylate ABC transporter permease, partial [Alcanivorax sp.]|nr:C4-dicarboxylate ABC transporter permease [Alcanivorax sp.]